MVLEGWLHTTCPQSQKKGTKAVTGAVPFQKAKLLSILGANMDILGANIDILGDMYILGANMDIWVLICTF